MSLVAAILAAGTLGVTSSLHCATMCGPLAAVGCTRSGKVALGDLGGYALARAAAYAGLGAAAGTLGAPLSGGRLGDTLRVAVAGFVALALLVRAYAWATASEAQPLIALGRSKPSPALQGLFRLLPRRGAALGAATALFPCGALWAALLAAAASGSTRLGAIVMAVFALSSLPLLLAPAVLGPRLRPLLSRSGLRRVSAVGLVGLAIFVAVPPVLALARPSPAACCHPR